MGVCMCMNIYIYIYICMNCFHCQTAEKIRLKFGMLSPSTRVSIITTCGCVNGCSF